MYYVPYTNPYPYYMYYPVYTYEQNPIYWGIPNERKVINQFSNVIDRNGTEFKDHGSKPFTLNINKASKQNKMYRTTIWTGNHLQVTLMSINVGDDIGLEIHPTVDQFLRIEQGEGIVQMGENKDYLNFQRKVYDDFAIMIPAGTWHNVINTGTTPLKLYSIYAPPQHPFGTVHKTKTDAMAVE